MKAIFDIDKPGIDYHMCSVPVPNIDSHKYSPSVIFTDDQVSAYGQSQTHPSIVYIENGWNGHQWWMATTPYPHSFGVFENPCIYYADTQADGTPPVVFTPINNNPVVKVRSSNDINSDPDLVLDETSGVMYLISRQNGFKSNASFLQSSTDGANWTERAYSDESKIIASGKIGPFLGCPELISPSVVKTNGQYLVFFLSGSAGIYPKNDLLNTGRCWGIYRGSTDQLIDNNNCFSYNGKTAILSNQIEPWHFDVFPDGDNLYMICCARAYKDWGTEFDRGLWLGKSTDGGITFQMYPRPLMYLRAYRPTATLDNNRNLVIYGSFENNPPKDTNLYPNGESDIAVDGRSIFMCYKNFDDILGILDTDIKIIP